MAVPVPGFPVAEAAAPVLIHAVWNVGQAGAVKDAGAGDTAEIGNKEVRRGDGGEADKAVCVLVSEASGCGGSG